MLASSPVWAMAWQKHHHLLWGPMPTARDPVSLDIYILWAENLPHFELPYMGIDHGIQLQSYDGATLVTVNLK